MRYFPKERTVLTLIISSLILFVFLLLVTRNTITNVSAVEANGVGVYWDSDYTNSVFSIVWGTLTPGSLKSIVVYIRNEVGGPIYLVMSTTNWNPSRATDYITLRWDYTGQWMNPGEALKITLTLSVSRYIEGISSFSFDILITGSNRLPGDANGDGKVNWVDLGLLGLAYGSTPGDPNWNPEADFNADGIVDWADMAILGMNYSENYP